MANFECKVLRILKKAEHPYASRLTIYNIGGYNCISNKLEDGSDRYNIGDLVVYIPENALLPEWLLKRMGFWDEEKGKGVLAGKGGNRVRPLKLRNIYSEGVLYPCEIFKDEPIVKGKSYGMGDEYVEENAYTKFLYVKEGWNVAEFLEIEKYEEPIPATMGGEIFNGGTEFVVSYDVEPIQKHMDAFVEGEMFEATEKLHGTQTRFIFTKGITHPETFGENKDIYIASKGQGDKGLFFKNNESNAHSYYVRAFKLNDIENKVVNSKLYQESEMLTLFGETIGMQDLKYGLTNGHIGYRLFDVYVGKPRQGRFLNYEECKAFAEEVGIDRVPSLFVGEYSYEKVMELTDGKTTYGKNKDQIREGVVIRPLNERFIDNLGRVMLKSVSQAYKLRKGETTEYN